MRQAQWTSDGIELAEVEPPVLRPGWVRLQVAACGICGTDLHLLRRDVPVLPGTVPGHEIVGTPLDGPPDLAEALYAVEPRSWCGGCDPCVAGQRHLCPRGTLLGLTERGGLSDFVDAPREALHRVPGEIDTLTASISEPLAVCVRAVHLARLEASSRVLVLGAGTIGLLSGMLARDHAREVAITARHPHQQAAAKHLGLLALDEGAAQAWALEAAPDVVIETVGGLADTLDEAVSFCRPAGRVVVVGVFAGHRPVNALVLMMKELTLVGSNTYGTDRRGSQFRSAVELLPRYRSEIEALQTHRFPLSSLEQAFECASDKQSGAIKVTIEP